MKIYAVHDSKVGAYMQPFFFRNKGEALRGWETTVNDPKSIFCTHPGDFTLFEIAEWDENSGMIRPYESKINLGLALDFVRKSVAGLLHTSEKIRELG